MNLIPYVVEQTNRGERSYDIYSRLRGDSHLRAGICTRMLTLGITSFLSQISLVAAMAASNNMIRKYGALDPVFGLAEYAQIPMAVVGIVMKFFQIIMSVCIGMAASMGAFLLMAGQKGKRCALPNSEVMIHQPLGGAQGQATDVQIQAEWLLKTKEKMIRMKAEMTGQDIERIRRDVERDHFMSAQEALEYGIIDEIFDPRKKTN